MISNCRSDLHRKNLAAGDIMTENAVNLLLREAPSPDRYRNPELAHRASTSSKGKRTKQFLALRGDEEVAFVSLDFLPEMGALVLYELFVPKAHRRSGLGTALVAIVEQMARDQGFERVTLTPHAFERDWSESALKAWYRRLGYAKRRGVPSEFEKAVGPDAT